MSQFITFKKCEPDGEVDLFERTVNIDHIVEMWEMAKHEKDMEFSYYCAMRLHGKEEVLLGDFTMATFEKALVEAKPFTFLEGREVEYHTLSGELIRSQRG